jgi:hypothetical protein
MQVIVDNEAFSFDSKRPEFKLVLEPRTRRTRPTCASGALMLFAACGKRCVRWRTDQVCPQPEDDSPILIFIKSESST